MGRGVDQFSSGLLERCADAVGRGADFPTIWQKILQRHRLVIGPPEQAMDGDRAQLRVRLSTGQWLVFDSATKSFTLG